MNSLVQPIIVNTDSTHEGAVLAAAMASLQAYKYPHISENEDRDWDTWLEGIFTKTVRRLKPAAFQKALETLPPESHIMTPSGEAMAYSPMTYEDFPHQLRRAQVSLELPHMQETPYGLREAEAEFTRVELEGGESPILVVNAELGMSTGKECAQVAHAYWMAWMASGCSETAFYPEPRIVRVTAKAFQKLTSRARKSVLDAGLTEFSNPTVTVHYL